MIAITGGTLYTPRRIAHDGVVLVEDDRIVAAGDASQVSLPDGCERVDAGEKIVCPGLVDIHVHGGDGADCTEGRSGSTQTTRQASATARSGTPGSCGSAKMSRVRPVRASKT